MPHAVAQFRVDEDISAERMYEVPGPARGSVRLGRAHEASPERSRGSGCRGPRGRRARSFKGAVRRLATGPRSRTTCANPPANAARRRQRDPRGRFAATAARRVLAGEAPFDEPLSSVRVWAPTALETVSPETVSTSEPRVGPRLTGTARRLRDRPPSSAAALFDPRPRPRRPEMHARGAQALDVQVARRTDVYATRFRDERGNTDPGGCGRQASRRSRRRHRSTRRRMARTSRCRPGARFRVVAALTQRNRARPLFLPALSAGPAPVFELRGGDGARVRARGFELEHLRVRRRLRRDRQCGRAPTGRATGRADHPRAPGNGASAGSGGPGGGAAAGVGFGAPAGADGRPRTPRSPPRRPVAWRRNTATSRTRSSPRRRAESGCPPTRA